MTKFIKLDKCILVNPVDIVTVNEGTFMIDNDPPISATAQNGVMIVLRNEERIFLRDWTMERFREESKIYVEI